MDISKLDQMFDVRYVAPQEVVVNWRREEEVYGGYTISKGLFVNKDFAEKVAKYYSKQEKHEYKVVPMEIKNEESVRQEIIADLKRESGLF